MTSTFKTLINGIPGSLVEEADRGLAYGDGVFETMLAIDGRIPLLSRHLSRLKSSCDTLGIKAPEDHDWQSDISWLADQQRWGGCEILKLTVTRGVGGHGYMPATEGGTTRIVRRLDFKQAMHENDLYCDVLKTRLGSNRQLAGMKHLNRLEQVLAARELGERGLQEGLVCNEHGFLIEAVSSNVILVLGDKIVTPKLDTAGVRGVMRDYLIEQCEHTDYAIRKDFIFASVIGQADEILLCNSVRGVRRVARLGDRVFEARDVYNRMRRLGERAFTCEPGARRV